MRNQTKCDDCHLPKTPIIYIRMTRKLCTTCWQAEKKSLASLINTLPDIVDKEAPLGYNFIGNDYFLNEEQGRKYADFLFNVSAYYT